MTSKSSMQKQIIPEPAVRKKWTRKPGYDKSYEIKRKQEEQEDTQTNAKATSHTTNLL